MAKISDSLQIGNTGYPLSKLVPYVLFEGNDQNITLSDSKNNYLFLEITYGNSWLTCGTVIVPASVPYVSLWAGVGWGSQLGFNLGCGYFNMSGKNITSNNEDRQRNLYAGNDGVYKINRENIVYIKRVVGYK